MEAAWGQQVIIDPNGNVGTRLQTGRAAPVVDIARPNSGGVSHNRYQRFNTPSGGGTVLNNSASGSNTAVAGQIAGNSNLASGSATTIVNEVTSTESSDLKGRIEVAGDRANVIVANPNGLSCDGCSFLNTNNATLSTGVPVIDGGTVRLDVAQGAVTIGRGGLDGAATGVASVNLIGRTVVVDGKVTAIDGVNVQGGAQRYDLTGAKRIEGLTPTGPAGSDYAIDGTAFGAMEAGRIQVVGNEQGLGVRLRGAQQANGTDVTITNPGRVEVSSVSAQRHVTVTSSNDGVEVDRDLSAATGRVAVTARNTLSLSARSGVYGETGIALRSTHGDLAAQGDLQSGANITVNGRRLSFGAYAVAADTVTFLVTDAASLEGASVVAQKIDGSSFGTSVSLANSAFFSAENLRIVTQQLSFGRDVLVDGLNETDSSDLVATVSGDVRNSGDLRAFDLSQISWSGNLYNEAGGILSAANLVLSNGGQIHNSGILYGEDSVTLNVASLFNNETGSVLSKAVQITTTGDLINNGTIMAEGDLRLTAGTALTNAGFVQAARSWWSGQSISNLGTGDLRIAGTLQMAATGRLLNQGSLNALGAITLSADQFTNAGMTISEQAIVAAADRIVNEGTLVSPVLVRLRGNTISSSGTLVSYDWVDLIATGSVTNSGALVADKTLSISGPLFLNTGETALVRARNGKINTASITNSGKIFLIDNFTRNGDIDIFENTGSFASAGSIQITGRDPQSRISLGLDSHLIAGLQANDDTQTLAAGKSLSLTAEQILIAGQMSGESKRVATIAAGGNIALQTSGVLAVGGNVQTQAGNLTLSGTDISVARSASVYAGGVGTLNSGTGLVNAGSFVVGRRLDLAEGFGRLTNSGVLSMGQTGSFTLTGILTNTGYLGSEAFMSLKAAGIRNDGHLQSGTWMNLETTGEARLRGATVASASMSILAGNLLLDKGLVTSNAAGQAEANTGFISAAQLQVVATSFTSRGTISLTGVGGNTWNVSGNFRQEGLAHSAGQLTINTAGFSTTSGSLLSSARNLLVQGATGEAMRNFDLSGSISGQAVTLRNEAAILLRASSVLAAAGNIALESSRQISLAGQASARNRFDVTANTLAISGQNYADIINANAVAWDEHSGTSYGKQVVRLGAGGKLINSGTISSAGSVILTGGFLLRNESGGKIEATDLTLNVNMDGANSVGALENFGELFGAQKLLVRADSLTNAAGAVIRAGTAELKTNGNVDNSGTIHAFGVFANIGGTLTNQSTIRGDEIITVVTKSGAINNTADGRVFAKIIGLASGAGLTNDGQIGATGSSSVPNATSTRISAAGWLTNNKIIRGEDIELVGQGVTNNETGNATAAKVLRVQSDTYGVFNHGVLRGTNTAVLAKTNFENHNRLVGSETLGIVAEAGRLYNNGILQGTEISLLAENGALVSEKAITAGNVLLAKAGNAEFKLAISAGNNLGLETTSGDLTLGGTAAANIVAIRAAGLLKAKGGMIRGANVTQIVAADIQRTDITATNRKLGVVPVNVGDLYVELKSGSFGSTTTTPLADGPGIALAQYEQANLNATGSVEIIASDNLFLTGSIKAQKAVGLQAKEFAALRNVGLTAGTDLHVQGNKYLKNYGNVALSANNVTLNQKWGWFYTSDWLPERVDYNLTVGAGTIVVNSDHRFVNRTVTLRAVNNIAQWDSVISARGIEYVAGKNITVEFDAFDWRGKKFTEFSPSYGVNPTSATYLAMMERFGMAVENPTLGWGDVSAANKTALSQADTSDWWNTVSAGLRGHTLIAQGGGVKLSSGQDLTLRSGKVHSEAGIDLIAGGRFLSEPIYIENDQDARPVNVGWSFDSRYSGVDSGHDRNLVQMLELRAYENQIFAKGDVNISAGGNLSLIGTSIRSANGNISLQSAGGGISMLAAPGYWAYNYEKTTTKKKLFGLYKKRTTVSVDRYRDIYKPTTLVADNGNVVIATTGLLTRDADSPAGSSSQNTILSAGTSITAKNVSVVTRKTTQSILLGTYEETDIDESRTQTSRKIFWVVPFGSSDSVRKRRVVTQIGNTMLADEILELKSAADLTIVGGSYAGKTVTVSAVGNLNIQAAINSIYESNYSRTDNMVTIATINSGRIVDSAALPKIRSVQPATFEVGGDITISGYNGPALNTLIINAVGSRQFDDRIVSLYTPKDASAANTQSKKVSDTYDYRLPYTGDYAYIRTLLNDHGATYETISLRNQTWYDKQVQLNPAFQALLSVAISAATGGIGGLTAWQKAALDSTLNSVAGGAITGNFDAEQALRSALTAGASSYISGQLIEGFGLTPPSTGGDLTLRGVQNRFTPELIRDRFGAQLVSHGVSNVVLGNSPFEGLDSFGRGFFVTESMGIVQNGIGDLGTGMQPGAWEGSLPHLLLHGGVGCLAMAAMDGGCTSGFFAGASQSVLSGSGLSDQQKAQLAPLVGGLAGFILSEGNAVNVSFGASISQSGFENNYLTHKQRSDFKDELEGCAANEECLLAVSEKYLDLSNRNNLELLQAISSGDSQGIEKIYSLIPRDMLEYQDEVVSALGNDATARELFAAVVNEGSTFILNGERLTATDAAFYALRDIYLDGGDVGAMIALGVSEFGPSSIVPNLAGILGARGISKVGSTSVIRSKDGSYRFASETAPSANVVIIEGKTCVYSCVIDGVTRYVGITDNLARRGSEHLREKGIMVAEIRGLGGISRSDARAVEQTLIRYYGLGKDGGSLLNKINSISPIRNPTAYERALVRGKELLDGVDYKWMN